MICFYRNYLLQRVKSGCLFLFDIPQTTVVSVWDIPIYLLVSHRWIYNSPKQTRYCRHSAEQMLGHHLFYWCVANTRLLLVSVNKSTYIQKCIKKCLPYCTIICYHKRELPHICLWSSISYPFLYFSLILSPPKLHFIVISVMPTIHNNTEYQMNNILIYNKS